MSALTQEELLQALEKAIPEISEEHAASFQDWQPHDLVPWEEGKNFALLGGEDWDPAEQRLADDQRAALIALLLTKDQNPSYHRLLSLYCPIWGDWKPIVGTWTAEDYRHAIALRDWLIVTRVIDPQDIEDRRLTYVMAGVYQDPSSLELGPVQIFTLLLTHELQCVQLINKLLETELDDSLKGLLAHIRDDDANQAKTFLSLLNASIVADPEASVVAIESVVSALQPLGYDIPDFDAQRALLTDYVGGDNVARDVAAGLKLESLELTGEAETARARLAAFAS